MGSVRGVLLVVAWAVLSAPTLAEEPGPSIATALEQDGSGLAKVKLGSKVAELIADVATKEETEKLGPSAKGLRLFEFLPAALPNGMDEARVFFRENKASMIIGLQAVPLSTDFGGTGTYSELVADLTTRYGRGKRIPVNADMLALLYGERAKQVRLREIYGWQTPAKSVVMVSFGDDDWKKRRLYTIVLISPDFSAASANATQ